jgi:hypothetical protein
MAFDRKLIVEVRSFLVKDSEKENTNFEFLKRLIRRVRRYHSLLQ